MTATKTQELASIIQRNEAEARNFDVQSQIDAITKESKEIDLSEAKDKRAFDQSQDYRHGHITFSSEINDQGALALATTLRRMTRMRPKKPIRIDLNSPGGSITEGFALLDVIAEVEASGCPVTIAVRGQACSMATVLLQAPSKRLVGANSFVMLHRASFRAGGTSDQVEDAVEEARMFEHRIYEVIANRSGKSATWWKKKLGNRKDLWFTAKEAVECGLADAIG